MKKVPFLLICFFLAFLSFAKVHTETHTLLFESDQYELTTEAKQILDDLAQELNAVFDAELTIEGHTDNQGNQEYNNELSAKRATAVQRYLVSKGVDEATFKTQYFGELKPVKSNATENNREQNRRVVITVTHYSFENLSDLNAALQRETLNQFSINSQKSAVLTGKKGAKLFIEENSFVDENGKVYHGKVNITVSEALEFGDFIAHDLHTVCDDRMLESGGMLQVSAKTENGQTLQLQAGKEISVSIPTQNRVKDMELFVSNAGDNWNQTNKKIENPLDVKMPPYPIFQVYYAYKLPAFRRDMSTKPVHPEKRGKPRKPRTPDPLDYKADIKWYNVFWRKSLEEDAHEKYLLAMEKYEKKVAIYEHFKGLYDHTMLNYDGNIVEYKEALKTWDETQKADSLQFISSPEYTQMIFENQRLYQSALNQHRKDIKEWKALRKQRVGEMADKLDEMGLTTADMANTYVSAMNELSWINIDRFYHLDAKNTRQITLKDKDKDEVKVFLVFNEINSMLPLQKDGRKFTRDKMPKNEEIHYFAYKVIDGKTWVCYKRVGAKNEYELTYKPYKFSELKSLLASMQRGEGTNA